MEWLGSPEIQNVLGRAEEMTCLIHLKTQQIDEGNVVTYNVQWTSWIDNGTHGERLTRLLAKDFGIAITQAVEVVLKRPPGPSVGDIEVPHHDAEPDKYRSSA